MLRRRAPACSPVAPPKASFCPLPLDPALPRIILCHAGLPHPGRRRSRPSACCLTPELNEDVTVRPDGHISTTVVPDEMAADRTVPELIEPWREATRAICVTPHLSVIVKTIAPIPVFVGGEVAQPGAVADIRERRRPCRKRLLVPAASSRAATILSLFIVRRGPNDMPVFLSARYDAVRLAQDPLADIRLAPFDVVMVPRLGVAQVLSPAQSVHSAVREFEHWISPTC